MGLYAPVRLLHKTKLLPVAATRPSRNPRLGPLAERGRRHHHLLRQHGWTPYGVDVSSYALNTLATSWGSTPAPSIRSTCPPKCGLGHHAPDHRAHPRPQGVALRSVRQLLKPGGILIVATHDVEGVWPKLVGPRWRHYNMPEPSTTSPAHPDPDALRGRLVTPSW